jgi:hypothetical protein
MRYLGTLSRIALLFVVWGCAGQDGPKMTVSSPDAGADVGAPDNGAQPPADVPAVEDAPTPDDLPVPTDLPSVPDLADAAAETVEPPEVVEPELPAPHFEPGHWECLPWAGSTQCVPKYETKWCGNGVCEPAEGESDASCPADCDPGDAAILKCAAPIDCIFLDWPLAGQGYWQCEWVGWGQGQECVPVPDDSFCGTPKGNWCAEEWGESPDSCPLDCAPEKLGTCQSHQDCIFEVWPLKQ